MVEAHFKISLLVVAVVTLEAPGLGDEKIISDCVSHHRPSTLTGLAPSATLCSRAVDLSRALLEAQEHKLKLAIPSTDLEVVK